MNSKYPYDNFYSLISYQGKTIPNDIALILGSKKIKYIDLLEKIDFFAGYLESIGISKGDRVSLLLRNSVEFIISTFAINKIGAISVPINTFLKESELEYIISNCGSKILIASTIYEDTINKMETKDNILNFIIWEGRVEFSDEKNCSFDIALDKKLSASYIKQELDDIFTILYTSGTTGRPKGAMLTNKNIFSNIISGIERLQIINKDRGILFLPMFHSFTFTIGLLLPLYQGASNVIIPSIRPFSNIFKQALLHRVTIFISIPDIYNALAKTKLPWYFMWFNSIRVFISGASPLHGKIINALHNKFKDIPLLEGYGLSEASPAISINPLQKQKLSSVGLPLDNYKIKIVDEDKNELPLKSIGEIIVFGDNVMKGYWQDNSATEHTIINGWLLTGDLGYIDEDGYLFIIDRKKDIIISKGIYIYPREVEDMINNFDGILVSALIGEKNKEYGEIPVAYIELDNGVKSIDNLKLKKYLKENLADYKLPKNIHIIDNIPKNATGKILKRALKESLI